MKEDSPAHVRLELHDQDKECRNGCPCMDPNLPQTNLSLRTIPPANLCTHSLAQIKVQSSENCKPPFTYSCHKVVFYLLLVIILFLLVIIAYLVWPWGPNDVGKSSRGQSQSQIAGGQKYVRLPETLMPEFYDVIVEVKMPSSEKGGSPGLKFNGSVTVTMLTLQPTSVIKLNAHKSVQILNFFLVTEAHETIAISR